MVKRTTRSSSGPREDVLSREYTIHINKRINHVYVLFLYTILQNNNVHNPDNDFH